MKIGFLITRADDIGGAQIHVRDLATRLGEEGHDAFVIAGARGVLTDQLRERGVRCIEIPSLAREISPRLDGRAFVELRRVLKAERPDLLSAHSSKAGILGRLAGTTCGIPTLFTAHGWAYAKGVPRLSRSMYWVLESLMAPLARRIITVSAQDAADAPFPAALTKKKIRPVLNGMLDIPAELLADPGHPSCKIVMTARFCPQKDHATLLQALDRLRELDWELDLIGEGPGRTDIEEQVRRLGLEDRVHFVGYSGQVATVLAEAQIYALTSHWEGLPRSVVEAMRAGLPIVVSDVGGAHELVVESENGFVVPANDVSALAERLEVLLRSSAARQAMGRASRKRFEETFTFERMYRDTRRVYREMIQA